MERKMSHNQSHAAAAVSSSSLSSAGYCMLIGVLCCCCNILYITFTVMTELHVVPTTVHYVNGDSFHQQQQSQDRIITALLPSNVSSHNVRIQDRQIQTLPQEWTVVTGTTTIGDDDPIRQLLMEALDSGRDYNNNNNNDQPPKPPVVIDETTLQRLPSVEDVTALYGPTPVVLGLETCNVFQHFHPTILDAAEHLVSVAGSFNTGTNLLAELLIANCYIPERQEKYQTSGVRWQVLWGKHTPVDDERYRSSHRTYKNATGPHQELVITPDMIFPAITIRDPFKWMQSVGR